MPGMPTEQKKRPPSLNVCVQQRRTPSPAGSPLERSPRSGEQQGLSRPGTSRSCTSLPFSDHLTSVHLLPAASPRAALALPRGWEPPDAPADYWTRRRGASCSQLSQGVAGGLAPRSSASDAPEASTAVCGGLHRRAASYGQLQAAGGVWGAAGQLSHLSRAHARQSSGGSSSHVLGPPSEWAAAGVEPGNKADVDAPWLAPGAEPLEDLIGAVKVLAGMRAEEPLQFRRGLRQGTKAGPPLPAAVSRVAPH